jgi:single-stranded-DNA-specific exonuclease
MAKMAMKDRSGAKLWKVRSLWEGRGLLAKKVRVPELVAQLLYNRGVSDFESAQRFLQPTLNDLIEPDQLPGMAQAVKRIQQALADEEKIVLYGDYDVDGITGVAILWHCLKMYGVEVEYYVPHRIEEGYGLNEEAIRQLARQRAKLIITVDCGITAQASAALAAEMGVDLIITDHHKLEGELPLATAIVHPDLPDSKYPNKNLCGAAVAFKLAWALAQEFSGAKKVTPEFREFLLSATALAALGTIADVVPLTGENRTLAHFGLQGLAASKETGIRALIEAAGLTGARLDSFDIGFKLAPRLNAAGRMGHARLAAELFTRSSESRAREIAAYLESQNRQRQKVEKEITAQAIEQVKSLGMDQDDWRGIVVADEGWHGGVIGIVASRIVDRYRKPTIVISIQQDKAMGSGRSVPGFDICRALEECVVHLAGFGGHTMAAGLNLEPARIEDFRRAFNEYACRHLREEDTQSSIDIDAEVTLEQLNYQTVKMIEQMGPFGAGNPKVHLLARNLHLVCPPRRMGQKGEHLQLTVAAKDDSSPHMRPGAMFRAVAFGKARWEKKLLDAQSFDLVFQPVLNHFNGNTTVEMIAEDFRIEDKD